jgi:predicted transcriptional regulator
MAPATYHSGMAMTLRLPDNLDEAARVLADREHRSLHGFVVNAVEEYIRRHGMDVVVEQIAAEGARKYADALDRLGKA